MKNIIKFIPVLSVAFVMCFSSCEKWLDVSPKSQVKDSELFSSETGFKEALAGVYSALVADDLYTKEMRWGMLDVIAHEWSSYSKITYPEAIDYDYTNDYPKNRIDKFWSGLYNAIVNANVILEVIDDKKSLFTGNNYSIIKGETLALRAFIHFELLRCFGVSYAVDRDKPSIPYVTAYTSLQSKQLTVAEVVGLVVNDLIDALELLNDDPVYTRREITEFDDNGYLINRQLHLNYYAVKGLLARIYLYAGEYGMAAERADEVIRSGVFEFVSQNDMISGADPSGAVEQLWGIDVNKLNEIKSDYFTSGDFFSLNDDARNTYYNNVLDWRYLYLFTLSETNGSVWFTRKFDGSSTAYYNNKMPMIKLSEMYFILSESRYRTVGDWLSPLNEVVKKRGLTGYSDSDASADFNNTLINEYRREFLSEGQLWFLYKRLNRNNIYGADVDMVQLKAYTFPLPKSELQAADRKDNR